jgi:hypothetical protein
MENTNQHSEETHQPVTPVEHDYEAHKENPAPAPTVNEPDNKGAGQAMKWIIPIFIVVLIIIWFFFFRNNTTT